MLYPPIVLVDVRLSEVTVDLLCKSCHAVLLLCSIPMPSPELRPLIIPRDLAGTVAVSLRGVMPGTYCISEIHLHSFAGIGEQDN